LAEEETIKHFSYRLDLISSKLYKNLDSSSLNQIKLVKHLESLPSEIRIPILQQEVSDYHIAVQKAQSLQKILVNDKNIKTESEQSLYHKFQEQINALQEEIHI